MSLVSDAVRPKVGDCIDFMRTRWTVRQVNGNRFVLDTPYGLVHTRTVDAHINHLIGTAFLIETCPTCKRPQGQDKAECDGCAKRADRT